MENKQMIERYIYAVVSKLPKAQRQDIQLELETLIEDMCEGESRSVTDVLNELGSPDELAKKYRDGSGYLIGPEYFPNYVWVLKIVLAAIGLSAVVSLVINFATASLEGSINIITDFIAHLFNGGVAGFGFVTLVFAVMEYNHVKLDPLHKTWEPSQLAPIPTDKCRIDKADCIATILFTVIVGCVITFSPEFLGAFKLEDGVIVKSIPVFNMEAWSVSLPLFLASLAVGLIDALIKLVSGVYSQRVLVTSTVTTVVEVVITCVLFKGITLFNPNFSREFGQFLEREFTGGFDLLAYWGTPHFQNMILAVMLLIVMAEYLVTLYKCLRYKQAIN